MQPDFRALARRHLWLSWWWGLGLVSIAGLVLGGLFGMYEREALRQELVWLTITGLLFFPGPLFYLGLPALLGGLLRLPLMRAVFRRSTTRAGLLLRTATVFTASVFGFWLLWQAWTYYSTPFVFGVLPRQHLRDTGFYFFGLSLPWLLTSVAAAWWLHRGLVGPGAARSGS